jgi:hypothetical protein
VVGASQVKLLGNWEELVNARKKERNKITQRYVQVIEWEALLSLSRLLALVSVSLSISLSQDLLESGLLSEFC